MRKLLASLVLVSGISFGAIAQVGSASNNTAASALSSIAITRTTTTGNTVVITVEIHTVGTTVSTVTDTGGSTYARRATATQGGFVTSEIWSTGANAAVASTSITVTVSAAGTFIADLDEFSGVSALGITATNTSASGQPNVSLTTQDANNYMVAGFTIDGTPSTTSLTGTLRQNHVTTAGANITGCLVDNTRATIGSLTSAVSPSAQHFAATALELRAPAPTKPPGQFPRLN